MESNAILLTKYHSAIENLQKSRDPGEEVSHLRHELRRVRDSIERMSGTPHALEQQASQFVINIDLCERELKANRKLRKRTIEQIKSLENQALFQCYLANLFGYSDYFSVGKGFIAKTSVRQECSLCVAFSPGEKP